MDEYPELKNFIITLGLRAWNKYIYIYYNQLRAENFISTEDISVIHKTVVQLSKSTSLSFHPEIQFDDS